MLRLHSIALRRGTVLLAITIACLPFNALGRLSYDNDEPTAHELLLRRGLLQAASGGQCASSWLGYQCTQLVCGRIRIHWSLGGTAPSGPNCSISTSDGQVAVVDPSSQVLHIALQTDVTGYVATSWPKERGVMSPADAVIGFSDESGAASVGAYRITGDYAGGVQPDASIDITNKGLEKNATALTMCFTRNISQVGGAANMAIKTATEVAMNFVASREPFKSVHLLSKDYKCGVSLLLQRTTGGPDDGGWRPSNVSGTGYQGDGIMAERLTYMRTHGALEFTGWVVLVPIGMFAARHRWLFAWSGVTGLWFQVHRVVQMLATVLVVAGFVLPWTSFNSSDMESIQGVDHDERMSQDPLLEAHERLAITLIAVLGLHIGVAAARPKPDAPWRRTWNYIHWWTGRGLALTAGINVVIGITLWRRVSGGSGVEWILPLVVFASVWMGLAVWLERRAPEGRGHDMVPAGGSPMLTAGFSAPSAEVPLSRIVGPFGPGGVPYNKL